MDCDIYLIGKVLEVEDDNLSIILRIEFEKFTNTYFLPKSFCDVNQFMKLIPGMKVCCIFNGNAIVRVLLEPALYDGKM